MIASPVKLLLQPHYQENNPQKAYDLYLEIRNTFAIVQLQPGLIITQDA